MFSQTISKKFDFCYGHRVWSQQLDPNFAEDTCLKCRHLHGHQGEIEVELSPLRSDATPLVNGMITDFKHLGWFKKWVDNVLDHKFIMDKNDPLFQEMFEKEIPYLQDEPYSVAHMGIDFRIRYFVLETINLDKMNKDGMNISDARKEMLEGMIFVNFVPTSENLARNIALLVNAKMKPLDVRCSGLKFNETPKSQTHVKLNII